MNSQIRDGQVGVLDSGTYLQNTGQAKENENGGSTRKIGTQPSEAMVMVNGHAFPMSEDEISSSNPLPLENHEDSNGEKVGLSNDDSHSLKSDDNSDGPANGRNRITGFEMDPLIWIPPEPADMEDDIESVANNDDDDECSDGTKWGQPSFSSNLSAVHQSDLNPKEERQNAMLKAMNGQFKILARRLLASEGITFPDKEVGDNWLDIVASLSWKAALLIKPDASQGKEMDPASYVKVKCIASGTRKQSEVINGLVFKKSAAHKHMPTKFRNPRLLLLRGVLGHSDIGLSSFDSMEQEKDHLEKSIGKMLEVCHPNVIMVEKTVSRDIQEILLKEGVTLVLDMKLHRLERIARCTGSPISSFADVLMNPKLKQCDSFHIEKFVEVHLSNEGGKKPSKTLMFLEGFPKPLGCTILLRGSDVEEMKKVKHVMQYTVFAAYHLILETSFFEDQRVFLTDKDAAKEENSANFRTEKLRAHDAPDSDVPHCNGATATNASPLKLNIGISPGSNVPQQNGETATDASALELNTGISNGALLRYNKWGALANSHACNNGFSSFQGYDSDNSFCSKNISPKDFILGGPNPGEMMWSQKVFPADFTALDDGEDFSDLMTDTSDDKKGALQLTQENMDDRVDTSSNAAQLSDSVASQNFEHQNGDCISKVTMQNKDELDNELDSESILILMSSQCITKQAVCEQSRLSRIKYYGNFDVSLGRYLQDILLNQMHTCSSCGEPPDAHLYSYTHRNGNVTVLVRHMPPNYHLSGESEGKIWMWTRCLRCERENGTSQSTPRVVISTAARNLSFGKFLELSFSRHYAARRLSKCGHSLHRDCLRFFGLGSNIAMFRYSSVEVYTACKPPPMLEFCNPNRQEWLEEEVKSVLDRGHLLFSEVARELQGLKEKNPNLLSRKCCGLPCVKEFSGVEDLLKQEKAEFQASMSRAIDHFGRAGMNAVDFLESNWLYHQLLLVLYIWDRRLHQLLQCKQIEQENCGMFCKSCVERSISAVSNQVADDSTQIGVNVDGSSSRGLHSQYKTMSEVESVEISDGSRSNVLSGDILIEMEYYPNKLMSEEYATTLVDENPDNKQTLPGANEDDQEACTPAASDMHFDRSMKEPYPEISNRLEPRREQMVDSSETFSLPRDKEQLSVSGDKSNVKLEGTERWIWSPFSEVQLAYRNDLQSGSLEKFHLVNNYNPSRLSPVSEKSAQEKDMKHFTIGPGGNVFSVSEDEISSIIACALAIAGDQRHMLDNMVGNGRESKGETNRVVEKSYSLTSENSVPSPYSSVGSFDSERSNSLSSLSSDEFNLGYDSSLLLASQELHPEISVNGKVALGGKYAVVCIHANQFYNLRKKCCPSELAYISSLSRCKRWDAQGGKSKALFAKSIDDRFIIKQIKKTEFDSFLKFANDYFSHVSLSLDSGSQTCLAKILGIYQVRQIRNGKEIKTDLMVMENLLFGHNISRIYDLKGAVFSRYVSGSNDAETVYLDGNFIEDMRLSPIYVGGKTKHLLQRAIWNDTSFLTSINVMDYSLLVGIDKQRHELVFGIIDYLRQYTWDKQLETWVKSSLVVPKNALPTVISPKEYKKRFRKFMAKYFLTVPDAWVSEVCSGPCKFCSHGKIKSSKIPDENSPEKQSEEVLPAIRSIFLEHLRRSN